jgi:hypothetical protein
MKIKFLLIIGIMAFFSETPLLFGKNHSTISLNDHRLADTEADPDLIDLNINVHETLDHYLNKGGTFIRLDPELKSKLILYPEDVVFPACSFGFCRSQTLWFLLTKYKDKITLLPPHATRYGFDPYNEKMNWQRSRSDTSFDEFKDWSGQDKCTRMGFEIFKNFWNETEATAEQLAIMKAYYDINYYSLDVSGKRRVYISFDKNTHVILYRLIQTNSNLDNVVVYHFPLADKVTMPDLEWDTRARGEKAYNHFSLILKDLIEDSFLQISKKKALED